MIEFDLDAGTGEGLELGVSQLDDLVISLDTPEKITLSILQQGPSGASFRSYTHQQMIPSDTWIITHQLNRYVSVTVIDSANEQVQGKVEYLSSDPLNTVVVSFSAGFSGTAYIV